MKKTNLMCALLASLTLAACAGGGMYAAAPAKVMDGALTGANGMTLYTFDKDAAGSGKSVCNGPCATNWPPLMVLEGEAGGADYSVVTRDDGGKQWAFKGMPLYYYAKDTKSGDRLGDGVGGNWKIAKP